MNASDAHRALCTQVDDASRQTLWGALDRLLSQHGPLRSVHGTDICLPCSVRYPCSVIQRITEAISESL